MAFSDSFRAVRWLRTLNLVLQAVLVLTLVGGLNYVAKNHAWRFDLTQQRKFSLSPETLSYIKELPRPVDIVVTLSPNNDNPELKGLIQEYVYATKDRPAGQIRFETIDVYQNRRKAEQWGVDLAGIVVLVSGDKRRIVTIDDLYTLKDKKRDTFRGEQVLTAAILDVANLKREKIYFITGHGELRIDSADAMYGLSTITGELKARNFDVEALDLPATRRIPADASLLVIAAPRSAFSRAEQEMLRQYLSTNAGRMLVFLEPDNRTMFALGIDDLLLDWGILVHNDRILDVGRENMTENQELLIRAFTPHPITKTLIDYGTLYLRLSHARTVVPDPGRSLGSGLNTVTIAATSETAWGERGSGEQWGRYDPGVDTRPLPGMEPPKRLGVIVASERLAVRDNLPFSVRGGKMVVFGNGDMIANGRLDGASLLIALNAVNWSVDRDNQLTVPPRPIERFQLSLSASDSAALRYAVLLVLPGIALFIGLVVYWTRKA